MAQMLKNLPAMWETRSTPGFNQFPGEGTGNPFLYSCLENPMDKRAQWAKVHRITKSWTWLSD